MSLKSGSNYSVLRRTNQDQGFGYAVLLTLTSSDSENLRSHVPKMEICFYEIPRQYEIFMELLKLAVSPRISLQY